MGDIDLKEGVAVFGFLQYVPSQSQGAFAEYITVKHNECAIKPKDVSFEVAAASTTEAITALQAIRDKGGLRMRSESKTKAQQQTIAGVVLPSRLQSIYWVPTLLLSVAPKMFKP